MDTPFDPLMSVLPFSSGHRAVPSCRERGAGLIGAGKAWWDGGTWLQSDMDCLDVSLSCPPKTLPCSEGNLESWVSGAEHVFREEADGRCNSKQSYPCFFDLHYDRRMVSDPPLATPQLPIFPGFCGLSHLLPFPGKLPKYLPQ